MTIRTKALANFGMSILATVLILGCESLPQGNGETSRQPLNAEEIRGLLAGNTISAQTSDGPYTGYFAASGEVRGRRAPNYRNTGVWWTDDGMWCVKWKDWWAAQPRCWRGYRAEKTVTWIGPDGQLARDVEIQEGNALGL